MTSFITKLWKIAFFVVVATIATVASMLVGGSKDSKDYKLSVAPFKGFGVQCANADVPYAQSYYQGYYQSYYQAGYTADVGCAGSDGCGSSDGCCGSGGSGDGSGG